MVAILFVGSRVYMNKTYLRMRHNSLKSKFVQTTRMNEIMTIRTHIHVFFINVFVCVCVKHSSDLEHK